RETCGLSCPLRGRGMVSVMMWVLRLLVRVAGARGRPVVPGSSAAAPGLLLALLLAAAGLVLDALEAALQVGEVDVAGAVVGEAALGHAGDEPGHADLLARGEVAQVEAVGHVTSPSGSRPTGRAVRAGRPSRRRRRPRWPPRTGRRPCRPTRSPRR